MDRGSLSCIFLLLCLGPSCHCQLTTTTVEVLEITSASECNKLLSVHEQVEYVLRMNLSSFNCPPNHELRGYTCDIIIYQKDDFELLGHELCIDVQGVPKTIPNTQLFISVSDGREELRRIFSVSRFIPFDMPYYVCSESGGKMHVTIGVTYTVDICEEAAGDMVNHFISLGTVKHKPKVSEIYKWTMEESWETIHVNESEYIIKVVTDKSYHSSQLKIKGQRSHHRNTKACITLLYVSYDYKCQVKVELHLGPETPIGFEPKKWRSGRIQLPLCYSYANRGVPVAPEVTVFKPRGQSCEGKFAIQVLFSNADDDDKDTDDDDLDKSKNSMRHLYMAVFISLISVCLLVLGLTCVCCLRVRSKRHRRSIERRRNRAVSSGNPGFDVSPVDPNIPTVSWSTSNPGQIVGLPTYEEAVGRSSDDANQLEGPVIEDKPPAYESLYERET